MKVRNMYIYINDTRTTRDSKFPQTSGVVSLSRYGKFWRSFNLSTYGMVIYSASQNLEQWRLKNRVGFLQKEVNLKTTDWLDRVHVCTWLGTENINVTKSIRRLVNCIDYETAKRHIFSVLIPSGQSSFRYIY